MWPLAAPPQIDGLDTSSIQGPKTWNTYCFGVSRLSSVLDWWLNGDMLIFSNYDNELHHNIFYCSDWTMGLLADCEQAFNTRDLYTALNVDKSADDNACMYVFLLYIFSFYFPCMFDVGALCRTNLPEVLL